MKGKYHLICKLCGSEFFVDDKNIVCCGYDLFEVHRNRDCFLGCKIAEEINIRVSLAVLLFDSVYLDYNPKLRIIFR